jgi:hypothetical protein
MTALKRLWSSVVNGPGKNQKRRKIDFDTRIALVDRGTFELHESRRQQNSGPYQENNENAHK